MQKRESMTEAAVAVLTPSINAALDRMDHTSVVCAYQVDDNMRRFWVRGLLHCWTTPPEELATPPEGGGVVEMWGGVGGVLIY